MAATKEFIVSCVRDAAEMETRIYTLNETADQLKARANTLKAETAAWQKKETDVYNKVKGISTVAEMQLERRNKKRLMEAIREEKGRGWVIGWGIVYFFIAYCLLFFPGFFGFFLFQFFMSGAKFSVKNIVEFMKSDLELEFIPTVAYFACCLLVLLIVYCIVFRSFLSKERQRLNEESEECRKTMGERLVEIQNIQEDNKVEHALALRKADSLLEQATVCREKADEINDILQDFYEKTEVIPPSYRRIDCMMIFVHVFRNDLADTMREAVTYYETQCFRNGVIRGLNNIAAQIGQLANAVRCVGEDIREINYNTSQLVRGTESVIENQRSIIDNQRVAIAETQATRYAVESLRYSHERYHAYR